MSREEAQIEEAKRRGWPEAGEEISAGMAFVRHLGGYRWATALNLHGVACTLTAKGWPAPQVRTWAASPTR